MQVRFFVVITLQVHHFYGMITWDKCTNVLYVSIWMGYRKISLKDGGGMRNFLITKMGFEIFLIK